MHASSQCPRQYLKNSFFTLGLRSGFAHPFPLGAAVFKLRPPTHFKSRLRPFSGLRSPAPPHLLLMKSFQRLLGFLACFLPAVLPPEVEAQNEVGFLEKFALASDRAVALEALVPGSPQYYYFHALHAQNTGDAPRFAQILEEWTKRAPHEPSERRSLLHRQALLDFSKNPGNTFAYLRQTLGVNFPHSREVPGAQPSVPEKINEGLLSVEMFEKEALSRTNNLSDIPDYALESWIARHATLSDTQRTALLDRLDFSETAALVDLVAWDLKREGARPFGSRRIHFQLLSRQLDDLEKKLPELSRDAAFVRARLRHLLPSAESDVDFDGAAREAWLEAVWKQVSTLPPSFNSLKANVLHRRLESDRLKGVYDRQRFLEYLRLPKRTAYARAQSWPPAEMQAGECRLDSTFGEELGDMRAIGSDEPLVRDFFLRLFDAAAKASPSAGEELARPYYDLVQAQWLRPVLAEALITGGHGNPETWASLLSPPLFQALKDRTDVEFPADNPPFLPPGQEVRFDVWVKNAPALGVHVYEVNALNVFLQQKREVNTDLNVDGLVPNLQKSIPLGDNSFARRRVSVSLPELKNRRGIWLVEVIGGGRSSRALLRIGRWTSISRVDPAGVQVTLLDEKRAQVRNAVAWLDGRRFESNPETGTITLPFLAGGPARPVVFSDAKGEFAVLEQFQPQPEAFHLDAGFHLEREQILAGAEPVLGMRLALMLGSLRLDPALLKDGVLRIRSLTRSGVSSLLEVKDPQIPTAGVWEQKVRIPEGIASLSVDFSAKMETLSQGAGGSVPLHASRVWDVNGIDATRDTAQAFLTKEAGARGDEWSLRVTGKNGEPLANRVLTLGFQRVGFNNSRSQQLRTDPGGRLELGLLRGIQRLEVSGPGLPSRSWDLTASRVSWPVQVHTAAGAEIRLPALEDTPVEGEWLLVEQRRGAPLRSIREKVSRENGFFVIRNLEPGDYLFRNRFRALAVEIRVTSAARVAGWFLGEARQMEAGNSSGGLQILDTRVDAGDLVVHVAGGHPEVRVHVVSRTFLEEGNLAASLGGFERWGLSHSIPAQLPNLYSAARRIGDEYRYILDRRKIEKFPGLMLSRPGLLLHPWETGDTHGTTLTSNRQEDTGQVQAGRLAAAAEKAFASDAQRDRAARGQSAASPNLDFLARPAVALWNLPLTPSGEVRLPLAALGDKHVIQIYAEDGAHFAWREFALGKLTATTRDRRLLAPFDPAQRFAETRQTSVLATGARIRLADAATSELEAFTSVREVFSLFQTLRPDLQLQEWEWLTRWSSLTEAEKKSRYSEHACHELHLFLWRKDPEFFKSVVLPHLSNKTPRTFMDAFLLGEELVRYLEPAAFGRLNALEKALLAWRLPQERAATARHVREVVQRAPIEREAWRKLFDSALRSRALSGDGAGEGLMAEPPRGAKGEENGASGYAAAKTAPGAPRVLMNQLADALPKAASAPEPQLQLSGTLKRQNAEKLSLTERDEVSASRAIEGRRKLMEKKEAVNRSDKLLSAEDRELSEEVSRLRVVSRDEALAKRKEVRGYFRPVGPTKEFAESNYFKVRGAHETPELVPASLFWQEFAEWVAGGSDAPFLSGRFPEASHNLNEMLLVLAVLDLPFKSERPVLHREGAAAILETGTAGVVFHRQIQPADAAPETAALQITQNFVRLDDRFTLQEGEKVEKNVTSEFLIGVPYASTVVVGNPTAAHLKGDLMWQIPAGALPLGGLPGTHSQPIRVAPFATVQFEFSFYFPLPSPADSDGFVCHPASVTAAHRGTAQATPRRFRVLERPEQTDKNSWAHISQEGTGDEVFAYLDQHPLYEVDLVKIAWRCHEKSFFLRLHALLRTRHVWHPVLASYALKHEDAAATRDWLMHRPDFIAACGPVLQSDLLPIDPYEQKIYEHLSYSPLVNPRAHRLGAEWRIANSAIHAQYQTFLRILAHKPRLDRTDRLAVSAYFLLQDRVSEARDWFSRVEAEPLELSLQYDYMRAVLELLQGRFADARALANKHTRYPVDRWRILFEEVLSHLDAAEGKTASSVRSTPPDRERETDQLAGTEPTFEVETRGETLKLSVRNLKALQLKFYPTDPEFSFSANPFSREESGSFRLIHPALTLDREVPEGVSELVVAMPDSLVAADVMVEIVGAGLRRVVNYSPARLKTDFVENYGRLEVRELSGRAPLAKVYVKVYARLASGAVRFFKDGYTDIRGRFDYASLNRMDSSGLHLPPVSHSGGDGLDRAAIHPGELDQVQKFAVLVLAEGGGAVIREVAAPSRADAPAP